MNIKYLYINQLFIIDWLCACFANCLVFCGTVFYKTGRPQLALTLKPHCCVKMAVR